MTFFAVSIFDAINYAVTLCNVFNYAITNYKVDSESSTDVNVKVLIYGIPPPPPRATMT